MRKNSEWMKICFLKTKKNLVRLKAKDCEWFKKKSLEVFWQILLEY